MTTIRHCFTLTELCWLIRTGETLTMVSGSVRDVRGIFKLIHKAVELSMPSVDTGFLEVHCYIDYIREHGAVSAQTAVDRRDGGIEDPALLTPFIDARIIGNTLKGRYYLRNPGEEETARTQDQDFYNRVLSNQVRSVPVTEGSGMNCSILPGTVIRTATMTLSPMHRSAKKNMNRSTGNIRRKLMQTEIRRKDPGEICERTRSTA